MSNSAPAKRPLRKVEEVEAPRATYVVVSDSSLSVTLTDGRVLSVPLEWYPRLAHGTPAERNNWEMNGRGIGIHWPQLDEDISVEGLIAGRRSMESANSFRRFLGQRTRVEKPTLEKSGPEKSGAGYQRNRRK